MVNESTVFKSNNEHTKSFDVQDIRYHPSNGGEFTVSQSDFIEIPIGITKNGFINPGRTTLNMTWLPKVTGADATGAYTLFSSVAGSHALIERVCVYQGSNLLEEVTDWNRAFANSSVLYSSPSQAKGNGSVRDSAIASNFNAGYATSDTVSLNVPTPWNRATGIAISSEAVSPVGAKQECALAFELSDLLGPAAEKLLPTGLANPIRVRIYITKQIEKVFHGLATGVSGVATSTYVGADATITNVSLDTQLITYDDDTMNKMIAAAGGSKSNKLRWSGTQVRCARAITDYSADVQAIVPNSQWSNLKAMVCAPFLPVMSKTGDNFANWGNGLYQAQLMIDGAPFPLQYTGDGSSLDPGRSLSQLVMSAVNCNRRACEVYTANTSFYPWISTTAKPAPWTTSNCNTSSNTIPSVAPNNSLFAAYPPSGLATSNTQYIEKSPVNFMYGFTLSDYSEGRVRRGQDTRARQVVLNLRQSNTIPPATASCNTLCIQYIHAEYELDLENGSIRSILQ
jgi:hypothetical protein